MTAQIRPRAVVLLALVGAMTLAACGGGGGSSSDKGGSSGGDRAAAHAAAEKIIKQAVAVNPKAASGRIDGTIDVKIKGVPRFKGTTSVTANGTYNLPDGASVPDFDIDVGLSLDGSALGGALVLADGKAFIKLGNSGYRVPDTIAHKIAAPAADARNGLTKTGAMFHINPQDWQKNAQLVGDDKVAGESVQHITADIRPERVFLDVARLTHLLTLLHVTQAVGLPTGLGPSVRAALVRSVKNVKAEVWIGTDDHVLRKAHLTGKLDVPERDRTLLGGVTAATLDATINISDVGVAKTISAPRQLGSYKALQLSLSALGEAVRKKK